jgi:hypothetical protein
MPKIKVHVSIKNDTLNDNIYNGIIKNNSITYKEEDALVNLLLFKNKIILKRKNEDYILEFFFEENNSYLKVNLIAYNQVMNVDIDLIKLFYENNKINIVYSINGDTFYYELEYDIIS